MDPGRALGEVAPGEIAGTHAVFAIGRELVVKLYGPLWPADHRQEFAALKVLKGRSLCGGEVALPQLVGAGELPCETPGSGGHVWPYVITRYVEGVPLRDVWPGLSTAGQEALAANLGAVLRELHRLPLSQEAGTWQTWLAAQRAAACDRQREWGDLPDHLVDQIPAFLASAGRVPIPGSQPALLSGDLTWDHVLVGDRHGVTRVVGLIDFGDSLTGDPEYEFALAMPCSLGLLPAACRALLAGYGYGRSADPQLACRMLSYLLLHPYPLVRELPTARRAALAGAPDLETGAMFVWPSFR